MGKLKDVPQAFQKSINRTQVEYRRLGKSGLRVSNPILGGLHIGDSHWFPWVLNEEKALPLLKAAYDRGINTVSMTLARIHKNPQLMTRSGILPMFIRTASLNEYSERHFRNMRFLVEKYPL